MGVGCSRSAAGNHIAGDAIAQGGHREGSSWVGDNVRSWLRGHERQKPALERATRLPPRRGMDTLGHDNANRAGLQTPLMVDMGTRPVLLIVPPEKTAQQLAVVGWPRRNVGL
jgi:hypothetical protein